MELYNNIRERRKALGMSQDELAAKLGYKSRATVCKIEAGKIDIPQSKIVAFAQALRTTPGKLMGTESNNIPRTVEQEQDRQNEIARAFLKLILKDKPEAQAYIDRATVTASGRIVLPGIDEVDQRYLDKMQRSLIEALHDATDNGNGTKTVNLKLP